MKITGKDFGMATGSLEAALRARGTLKSSPEPDNNPPGMVHRPVTDERVPSCEQAARPERMTLWGRCGYVPESRIKFSDR
jgi:hypothetical protein